jgi:hypothetical protein
VVLELLLVEFLISDSNSHLKCKAVNVDQYISGPHRLLLTLRKEQYRFSRGVNACNLAITALT